MTQDYYELFMSIYGVNPLDHGIQIVQSSNVHVYGVDVNKKAIVVDIKFSRSPKIIRNKLSVRSDFLFKLISSSTLKPHKPFLSLFNAIFPLYNVRIANNIALATGVDKSLLFFRKQGAKFDDPVVLTTKEQVHQALRGFILPLIYTTKEVKPREYISERTPLFAKKANDILCELGWDDAVVFMTRTGIILECGEKDLVIISTETNKPKRSDKKARVYNEYLLMQKLLI